jgi:hypothetical protein
MNLCKTNFHLPCINSGMNTAFATLCLILISHGAAYSGQEILVQDLSSVQEPAQPDPVQYDETGELETTGLYANAAAQNKQYCEIVLFSGGTMRPSPDNTELTSSSFGGVSGRAQVVATNSSYKISIDDPMGFASAPPGADDGTIFSTSYSGTGDTSFSRTAGNIPVNIKNGTTNVEVDLTALKNNDAFPAGTYSASLTLRCE